MVQYRAPLKECGIGLEYEPLLPDEYVRALSDERSARWGMLAAAYARRLRRLFSLGSYDAVWVQCDLLPYLPGVLEVLPLGRRSRIVYDCDDAVYHTYDRHRLPLVRVFLGRKLEPLLRRARAATCGNDYLRAYVGQFCAGSEIIPTVVDTVSYRARNWSLTSTPAAIGWIGSPSTWAYVKPLVPLLRDLTSRRSATFRAIGVGAQSRDVAEFEFVDWTLETEVREIQRLDIGIMPLTDDPWSRGKCGYKLIQYMACGLPVVASPVGVNAKIVRHGENGFLAKTPDEWVSALNTLIADPALCQRMGQAGRALVEREYSLLSQVPRVADILRRAAA
ncbi:MAG: glycosyltransferase family 4 protein [Alphaproteobacteria bacterium]|nr:glycosyltransferase family 4 protein [Alphaproteobacteria bacterium]